MSSKCIICALACLFNLVAFYAYGHWINALATLIGLVAFLLPDELPPDTRSQYKKDCDAALENEKIAMKLKKREEGFDD